MATVEDRLLDILGKIEQHLSNDGNGKKSKARKSQFKSRKEFNKYLDDLDKDLKNENNFDKASEIEKINLKKEQLRLQKKELATLLESKKLSEDQKKRVIELKESINELEQETTFDKKIEAFEESTTKAVSKIKDFYSTVKSLDDPWAKADDAASKFTKTVGGTKAAMDALRSSTIDNVAKGIATSFNVSMEELVKAQTNYVNGIGRNISIDNVAKESLAAIASFSESTGIDGLGLAAQLENFGLGIEKTGDHLGKMFSDASKSGINLNKYADNVAKNIKIAQNYTFKDGIKGLESMAKKATAIKLDMQQIANFAEKVNTVEGAIEASAKIQVLGGPFAAMSDPMGMLNEALNDIEGLGDRQIKLLSQFGHLNKVTGEVTVGSFDKQRIRAYAEATGQDYSALMEQVHTATKRREIDKQIESSARASKFDDELKEYIKNTGTIKDGKVGVSVNGEFKTLDQLDPVKDKEYLKQMSQGQSEDIKQIAIDLRSLVDKRSGVAKAYEAWQAKMLAFVGHIEEWALGLFDSGFGRAILGITASLGALKLIPATMKLFSGISGLVKAPFNFIKSLPFDKMFGGLKNVLNKLTGNIFKRGAGRALTRTALRLGGRGLLGSVGTSAATGAVSSGVMSGIMNGLGSAGTAAMGTLSSIPGIGWIAAATLAAGAIGTAIYKKAKAKNKKALDTQLAEKGIEVQGNYGNKRLKNIDKALQTGEISDRLRRKMIAKGDIAIVEEIEKKKAELQNKEGSANAKEEIKQKFGINKAEISIGVANFKNIGSNANNLSLYDLTKSKKDGKRKIDINALSNGDYRRVTEYFNTINSVEIKPNKKASIANTYETVNKKAVSPYDGNISNIIPGSFDININGSLKLDGGNGQSIDIIDEIKKSSSLKRELVGILKTEIINGVIEELRRLPNGGAFIKNSANDKFGTFSI